MDIFLLSLGFGSIGYWINKNGKNVRDYQVRTEMSPNEKPIGDHVYSSDDFNKINKELQQKLNSNFENAKKEKGGWVNPELLSQGRNTKLMSAWDRIPDQLNYSEIEQNNTNIQKQVLQENFVMSNTLPYYSSSSLGSQGLNYESFLRVDKDGLSPEYGPDLQLKNKRDVPNLFKPINQEPHKKLGSFLQRERLEPSGIQNGFNPFLQDRETPLLADVYQPGQAVSFYRPEPKTIDEIRVKERPVLDNQIQMGGNSTFQPKIGEFNQNKKDTFYENSIDRGQITPALAAKKPKQRLNFQLRTNKVNVENYLGNAGNSLEQPTQQGMYERITNNSSQKTKNSLIFPSQTRNIRKAIPVISDNKETFTPYKTIRDEQGDKVYLPGAKFYNKGKVNNSQIIRDTKQELDTEIYESFNNSQITATNRKPGAYHNQDNFVIKYSTKEFQAQNDYLGPAGNNVKSGNYKNLNFKKKRDTKSSLYTPGPDRTFKYNNSDTLGDNRANIKNVMAKDYLNSGSMGLNEPVLKDYKLNSKRSVGDNNRLFEDSEKIKSTYENDFRPKSFI